jgi:hypothetical protein
MDQLGKVQKVFIDSIAEATSCLGINLEPNPYPKWNQKEEKQHGCKTTHQLVK